MSVSIGSENDPVSVSLPPFFSDKRKACRRQGETTAIQYQVATSSADEPQNLNQTQAKYQ
ncbi:hypothetical protein MT390_18785 [Vibrio sp. 2-Bac 85]